MTINKDAQALIAKINKKQGEGAVIIASEMRVPKQFTTGILSLDLALGGGWPANQWAEIAGKESHGKTTLVYLTIAANQRLDPEFTTLWVAAEHYDHENATALGVDNDRVIVLPTQDMEYAYDSILEFAESQSIDCVVIDSYPALVPSDEAEKAMDEFTMASGARLNSKFFRKAGHSFRRDSREGFEERPILGLMINQFRDLIGGYSPRGTPQTTPGGNAKNYAFYVRVTVKRDDFLTEKIGGIDVKVGQTIKVTTTKNKQAPPQQTAMFDFYFRDAAAHGFNRGEVDMVKDSHIMGIIYGVIERRGAWQYFNGEGYQGSIKMVDALREQPDLLNMLNDQIRDTAAHEGGGRLVEEDVDAAASTASSTRKVRVAKKTEEE